MRSPRFKTNKGFLLAEAIISITILVMIAAIGASLLTMGHRAINVNKNSLEASWLAQETAESLRGLRDTNWIRYAYNKELCWNIISSTGCDKDSTEFLDGEINNKSKFSVQIPLTGAPEFTRQTDPLDLGKGPNAEFNKPYLVYDINSEPTKYYREIQTYEFSDGTLEGVECLVTIAWFEGSKPQTIKLPVTLTNYQLEE